MEDCWSSRRDLGASRPLILRPAKLAPLQMGLALAFKLYRVPDLKRGCSTAWLSIHRERSTLRVMLQTPSIASNPPNTKRPWLPRQRLRQQRQPCRRLRRRSPLKLPRRPRPLPKEEADAARHRPELLHQGMWACLPYLWDCCYGAAYFGGGGHPVTEPAEVARDLESSRAP